MVLLYISGYIFVAATIGSLIYRELKRSTPTQHNTTETMAGIWGGALWPIALLIVSGIWVAKKLTSE